MGLFSRLFGKRGKNEASVVASLASQQSDTVTFDAAGIKRTLVNGTVESVSWEELDDICILTTDEGPFVEDLYWVLSGNGRGCAISAKARGMTELLPRLQALPGFDNGAVVQAMGSTSNAKFQIWSRPNAP